MYKHNIVRKSSFLIFFLIAIFQLPAITSQELYLTLENKGFSPKKEVLPNTLSLLFPFNIRISFGSEQEKGTLLFVINQKSMNNTKILDIILDFSEYLKKTPSLYKTEIIFTVDNILKPIPEGIHALIETIDSTIPTAVIILSPNEETSKTIIKVGEHKTISPLWLMKDVIVSLNRSKINWDTEVSFISLYRLGWLTENPILGSFFLANIPAIEINTPMDDNVLPFLVSTKKQYFPNSEREWDKHYSFFKFNQYFLFVPEHILILIMILVTGITFFILFMFSFLFGEKQYEYRKDFQKTWYLIPILFIVTFASLYFGQKCVLWIFSLKYSVIEGWKQNPFIAILLKGALSYFIFSVIMLIQRLIRFPEDSYIYGFLVNIICLINMLLFIVADFSLILLFITEYILSLIFRKTSRLIPIIFVGILMIIPFILYGKTMFETQSIKTIESIFSSSILANMSFSLILIPIELFIIRIIVKLGYFGKNNSTIIPFFTIAFFITTSSLIVFLIIQPQFTEKKPQQISIIEHQITNINKETNSNIELAIPIPGKTNLLLSTYNTKMNIDAQNNMSLPVSHVEKNINILTTERSFLDRKHIKLTITTKIKPVKIDVIVYREYGYAIYDATYPFVARDNGNICEFTLDENPPLPFLIEFTTAQEADIYVNIIVYSLENPNSVSVISNDEKKYIKSNFLYKAEQIIHFEGLEVNYK